ncbi:MAG: hypothetical protein ABSD56_06805 [Bryobacteraceae bacterium]
MLRQKNFALAMLPVIAAAGVLAVAVNLAVVAIAGGYDFTFGPLHLVAHDAFKPEQILVGTLVLALFLKSRGRRTPGHPEGVSAEGSSGSRLWQKLDRLPGIAFAIPALAVLLYLPTLSINFAHPDWTQAHIGASIRDLHAFVRLFTDPRPDGSYRPLGALSLWLDYAAFGTSAWGYHLINIGLHAANVFLAMAVYRLLGFGKFVCGLSALLFAVAPVNVEPVVWPAARYDLLACTFALGALICAVRYLRRPAPSWGLALAAFALTSMGILSKETAYAVPLLVVVLTLTATFRRDMPRPRSAAAPLLVAVWLPALIGLTVRFAIYKGLGGYAYLEGHSPVFGASLKTLASFLQRVLLVLPGAFNAASQVPVLGRAALVGFAAVALLVYFFHPAAVTRKSWGGLALGLAGALPVVGLVGWIGPSMLHTRYLYFPAVWILLFAGACIGTCRYRLAVGALFVAVSLAGTISNLQVYRNALQAAERVHNIVRMDAAQHPPIDSVCFDGLPEASHGILFFGDHVVERVRSSFEGTPVSVTRVCPASTPANRRTVIYRWDPKRATVARTEGR